MMGNYMRPVLIQKPSTDTVVLCTNVLAEVTSASVGLSGVNIISLSQDLPTLMGHFLPVGTVPFSDL